MLWEYFKGQLDREKNYKGTCLKTKSKYYHDKLTVRVTNNSTLCPVQVLYALRVCASAISCLFPLAAARTRFPFFIFRAQKIHFQFVDVTYVFMQLAYNNETQKRLNSPQKTWVTPQPYKPFGSLALYHKRVDTLHP